MGGLFSMESPLFRFLSRLADIVILNLLFVLCSIPIVTIGASLTALNYVMLKIKDNEEGYITRSFFHSFKQNFRQATVIWLIMLLLAIVLGIDFYLTWALQSTLSQTMLTVMRVLVYMGVFLWLMLFSYVFPLQAKFYNSIWGTFRNAALLALGNFPWTFCMVAVLVLAVIATFWNAYTMWYGIMIWLLMGFALVAWIDSHILHRVFKKILPPEEKEEDADHWEVPEDDVKMQAAAEEAQAALEENPAAAEPETVQETEEDEIREGENEPESPEDGERKEN